MSGFVVIGVALATVVALVIAAQRGERRNP